MTPAVASERSIFTKNQDYNSYIKSFPCRGEHVRTYNYYLGVWMHAVAENYRHTHTHTHTRDSKSDDNNKDYSKRYSALNNLYCYILWLSRVCACVCS